MVKLFWMMAVIVGSSLVWKACIVWAVRIIVVWMPMVVVWYTTLHLSTMLLGGGNGAVMLYICCTMHCSLRILVVMVMVHHI